MPLRGHAHAARSSVCQALVTAAVSARSWRRLDRNRRDSDRFPASRSGLTAFRTGCIRLLLKNIGAKLDCIRWWGQPPSYFVGDRVQAVRPSPLFRIVRSCRGWYSVRGFRPCVVALADGWGSRIPDRDHGIAGRIAVQRPSGAQAVDLPDGPCAVGRTDRVNLCGGLGPDQVVDRVDRDRCDSRLSDPRCPRMGHPKPPNASSRLGRRQRARRTPLSADANLTGDKTLDAADCCGNPGSASTSSEVQIGPPRTSRTWRAPASRSTIRSPAGSSASST